MERKYQRKMVNHLTKYLEEFDVHLNLKQNAMWWWRMGFNARIS